MFANSQRDHQDSYMKMTVFFIILRTTFAIVRHNSYFRLVDYKFFSSGRLSISLPKGVL